MLDNDAKIGESDPVMAAGHRIHAESVSVQEAADRLSVSPTTIRRLIVSGDFPHAFRVRTCIRIPLSDLDSFERKARVFHVGR